MIRCPKCNSRELLPGYVADTNTSKVLITQYCEGCGYHRADPEFKK